MHATKKCVWFFPQGRKKIATGEKRKPCHCQILSLPGEQPTSRPRGASTTAAFPPFFLVQTAFLPSSTFHFFEWKKCSCVSSPSFVRNCKTFLPQLEKEELISTFSPPPPSLREERDRSHSPVGSGSSLLPLALKNLQPLSYLCFSSSPYSNPA